MFRMWKNYQHEICQVFYEQNFLDILYYKRGIFIQQNLLILKTNLFNVLIVTKHLFQKFYNFCIWNIDGNLFVLIKSSIIQFQINQGTYHFDVQNVKKCLSNSFSTLFAQKFWSLSLCQNRKCCLFWHNL